MGLSLQISTVQRMWLEVKITDDHHVCQQSKLLYKKVCLTPPRGQFSRLSGIMHRLRKLLLFHVLTCLGQNGEITESFYYSPNIY